MINKESYKNEFVVNNASSTFSATPGFQQTVDTITEIVAGVVEQKFYQLLGQTPADFIDIEVGKGAYSSQLFQYRAGYVGDSFESCLVSPSTGIGRNAQSSIIIDGFTVKNNFWRMEYVVSEEQLRMALVNAETFSLIEENEKSRKKNWDLGIQKVVFLGTSDGENKGILNQTGVTINTSLITADLNVMTYAQLKTFAASVLGAYLANSNNTVMPNRFLIPTSVFAGLGAQCSDYPFKSIKEVLLEAFVEAGAVDMKFVHCAYAQTANTAGTGNRYVLYRKDPDSLIMYNPKPYTPHALYPINGLDSVSVAEGQFTGVVAKRPAEMLYLEKSA